MALQVISPRERYARQRAVIKPYSSLDLFPDSTQDQLAAAAGNRIPLIIVIYYGGTIGMTPDERGQLVPTNDAARLLEPLSIKGLDKCVQVAWLPVYGRAIDSTNGRWVHWVSIANAIRLLYDCAAGFVVCGGTDTMAHMIAAMNFMFPNIGKPIIGAGSQLPMFELGDDATNNLYYAITTAAADVSGAHLAFGDELMHGLHVHKVQDRRFRAFACESRYMLGHFAGEVELYDHCPRRNTLVNAGRLKFKPDFREGIKVVKLSPATPSESILHDAQDPTCPVLLLITYGAGNVRDEGVIEDERMHIECLRELYDRRYPVILGSPMMDGKVDSPYRTGALAVSTEPDGGGAISGGDTTGPTLEVKAMIALKHATPDDADRPDYDAFRRLMHTDFVGELNSIKPSS
ncbi:MAG: asparaginase domain-containing protein [Patescibacteria group bacterium]|mgnify:CR=1 FL=1